MKKLLIIILAIVLIIGLYTWTAYNGLVISKEAVTAQWQQVETQYQRRFDLIPNLVESVKGAMSQEQAIFTALAEARTRYAGAQTVSDRAVAASQVETSLGRLLAVIENYPALKSIDAVQNLMTQLEGTENRVSVERQRFNESVRTYNVAIKRFPKSMIASIFGFEELAYFEAQTGADIAPKVQF
ncbi:MAG: LemA family protein [Candidatus Taylorbacteria bacterium RIFCSPLOWO2_01_FULL_44_26]|uniref:LemA family protein n=2 Tax=Candidatus Tayloriibacteriota TaxID=1817919 RepID=A0A1G2MKH6_9BACT|nr:MAG: LemA family protein [Candidatus Taylorbacteria bacterium RIFCSPHIGHO2_02_FULL_44_12]OHA30778.1 MAG: LemA family protein [Candidatus Taylorbacteria bacterium RIFCSPLOWO2_01_FULL_44_26]